MDVSRYLGKVMGIYLIIVSIAMFTNMPQFIIYVKQLLNNIPLMFITGFFTLIIGTALVVAHNIWQWNWRVIITVLSWLVLIKGASIILFPHVVDQSSLLFLQNINWAYAAASFDFFLGLLICYFSFRR